MISIEGGSWEEGGDLMHGNENSGLFNKQASLSVSNIKRLHSLSRDGRMGNFYKECSLIEIQWWKQQQKSTPSIHSRTTCTNIPLTKHLQIRHKRVSQNFLLHIGAIKHDLTFSSQFFVFYWTLNDGVVLYMLKNEIDVIKYVGKVRAWWNESLKWIRKYRGTMEEKAMGISPLPLLFYWI